MKKLAIGCGIVLLVVGIAVVGIGYYGYVKVKGTVAQLAELGQFADIEKGVKNKSSFTPPASKELTAAQVDRLLQVQTRVHDKMGAGAAAMERNYKTLLDKKDGTTNVTDLPALLGAYKDLARLLVDAKRTQVDVLNELNMSIDEYRWIKSEVYHSLGVPFVDMDISQITERTKNGQTAGTLAFNGVPGDKPLEANVKLVEKHRKQFEDNIAMASFGL
jgi:hypothetical protein